MMNTKDSKARLSPRPALLDCLRIELPKVESNRQGNMTYVYEREHLPFSIQRVYYLYDVPGGAERAGHAHRTLDQIIIAASGAFDVILDDGTGGTEQRTLNQPYFGLYVPRMIWRRIVNFSSGSVCLVFASQPYDEGDYIRSYKEYSRLRRGSVSPAEDRI